MSFSTALFYYSSIAKFFTTYAIAAGAGTILLGFRTLAVLEAIVNENVRLSVSLQVLGFHQFLLANVVEASYIRTVSY